MTNLQILKRASVGIAAAVLLSGCGGGGSSSNPSYAGVFAADITRSITSRLVVEVDANNLATATLVDETSPTDGWTGQGTIDSGGGVSIPCTSATLGNITVTGSISGNALFANITGAVTASGLNLPHVSTTGFAFSNSYSGNGTIVQPPSTTPTTASITAAFTTANNVTITAIEGSINQFTLTGTVGPNGAINVSGTVGGKSLTGTGQMVLSSDATQAFGYMYLKDANGSTVDQVGFGLSKVSP